MTSCNRGSIETIACEVVNAFLNEDEEKLKSFLGSVDPEIVKRVTETTRELAKDAFQQRNYDKAIAYYLEILAVTSDSDLRSTTLVNLGLCKNRQNLLDEALSYFMRAISANRANIKAWLHSGVALEMKGKLEDALAVCKYNLKLVLIDKNKMKYTESDGKYLDPNHKDMWNVMREDMRNDNLVMFFIRRVEIVFNQVMKKRMRDKYSTDYSKWHSGIFAPKKLTDDYSTIDPSDDSTATSKTEGYSIEYSEGLTKGQRENLAAVFGDRNQSPDSATDSSTSTVLRVSKRQIEMALDMVRMYTSNTVSDKQRTSIETLLSIFKAKYVVDLPRQVCDVLFHPLYHIWSTHMLHWCLNHWEQQVPCDKDTYALFIGPTTGPFIDFFMRMRAPTTTRMVCWIPYRTPHQGSLITSCLRDEVDVQVFAQPNVPDTGEIPWDSVKWIIFDPLSISFTLTAFPVLQLLRRHLLASVKDAAIDVFPAEVSIQYAVAQTTCTRTNRETFEYKAPHLSQHWSILPQLVSPEEWEINPLKPYQTCVNLKMDKFLSSSDDEMMSQDHDEKIDIDFTNSDHGSRGNSVVFQIQAFNRRVDGRDLIIDTRYLQGEPFGCLGPHVVWINQNHLDKHSHVSIDRRTLCPSMFSSEAIFDSYFDTSTLMRAFGESSRVAVVESITSLIRKWRKGTEVTSVEKLILGDNRHPSASKKTVKVALYNSSVGVATLDLLKILENECSSAALDYKLVAFESHEGEYKAMKRLCREENLSRTRREVINESKLVPVVWKGADGSDIISSQAAAGEGLTGGSEAYYLGVEVGRDCEARLQLRKEDIREIYLHSQDNESVMSWCNLANVNPESMNRSIGPFSGRGYHLRDSLLSMFIMGSLDCSGIRDGLVPILRYVHSTLLRKNGGLVFPLSMRMVACLGQVFTEACVCKDSTGVRIPFSLSARNSISLSPELINRLARNPKLLTLDQKTDISTFNIESMVSQGQLRVLSPPVEVCNIPMQRLSSLEQCPIVRKLTADFDCSIQLTDNCRPNCVVFWSEWQLEDGKSISYTYDRMSLAPGSLIGVPGAVQCLQIIDELSLDLVTSACSSIDIPVVMTANPRCTDMRFQVNQLKFNERIQTQFTRAGLTCESDMYSICKTNIPTLDLALAGSSYGFASLARTLAEYLLTSAEEERQEFWTLCLAASYLVVSHGDLPSFQCANNFLFGCLS